MMRAVRSIFACTLALSGLAAALAMQSGPGPEPAKAGSAAKSSPERVETRRTGVWQAPRGLAQTPIWPAGAPDMEGASRAPESVLTAQTPEAIEGDTSEAVFDVTVPTMTLFPPRGRNGGAAIVVFPGGGFRALAMTIEGTEVCSWIAARGISCILAKYRVPGSNHFWDPECRCAVTPRVPRALQDAQRTIRLVRSRARELGVDPGKIGVMGFSAGGYLVAQTSNIFEPAYRPADAADRVSSRPDFAIAFFPGHLCRSGDRLDPGIHATARTPPTFLLQAWDDPVDPICNSTLYARALDEAGVPAEVHLFARGGHAFALRPIGNSVEIWPTLLESWLGEIGILPRAVPDRTGK